jgi:hypothetical protein
MPVSFLRSDTIILRLICCNCNGGLSLCALIIVTNTEAALGADTVSPEATKINASLWELSMSEEEPEAENWLSKNIKDGISHDLLIDAEEARSVGDSPDAVMS